ncbi:MAG: helix-turn-helix domain-containing protein [Oscillospiraceae bacterium]|nr:helix-turn-helix domain-containing protein [Oscillospiraceae bacterium]
MESKETYKVIGENIDYIREHKIMTVPRFAEYIKTSKTQLINVLKGERGFSITKLLEISEITNFPISFILTGEKITVNDEVAQKLILAEEYIRKAEELVNSVRGVIR